MAFLSVFQMLFTPKTELQQLHSLRLFDEQSPRGRRSNGAGRCKGRADDDGTGAGGEENHLGCTEICCKSRGKLGDSQRFRFRKTNLMVHLRI